MSNKDHEVVTLREARHDEVNRALHVECKRDFLRPAGAVAPVVTNNRQAARA